MNLQDLYNQHNQQLGQSNWQGCTAVGSPHLGAYIRPFDAPAPQSTQPKPKKGGSMFSQVATDVKGFIVEHRSVIYFLAVALLLDHFLFKGVFRLRLHALAEKLVSKVEERLT